MTAPARVDAPMTIDLRRAVELAAGGIAVLGLTAFVFGRAYLDGYYGELGVARGEITFGVEEAAFSAAFPVTILAIFVAAAMAEVSDQRPWPYVIALYVFQFGVWAAAGIAWVGDSPWQFAALAVLFTPVPFFGVAAYLYRRGEVRRAVTAVVVGAVLLTIIAPWAYGSFRARAHRDSGEVGEAVVVDLRDGTKEVGGLVAHNGDFLLLFVDDELVRIPREDVARVTSD